MPHLLVYFCCYLRFPGKSSGQSKGIVEWEMDVIRQVVKSSQQLIKLAFCTARAPRDTTYQCDQGVLSEFRAARMHVLLVWQVKLQSIRAAPSMDSFCIPIELISPQSLLFCHLLAWHVHLRQRQARVATKPWNLSRKLMIINVNLNHTSLLWCWVRNWTGQHSGPSLFNFVLNLATHMAETNKEVSKGLVLVKDPGCQIHLPELKLVAGLEQR